MAGSVLDGKRVLAVDDEPDVLSTLEDEIRAASPTCAFETATTYADAAQKLASRGYDVVILDIMGVRGFELLEQAVKRNFRVAMLTAHSLNPESLKRAFDMRAQAYLPKEKLGEIVPFLEDVLTYDYLPGWKQLLTRLGAFFEERFGKLQAGYEIYKELQEEMQDKIRRTRNG